MAALAILPVHAPAAGRPLAVRRRAAARTVVALPVLVLAGLAAVLAVAGLAMLGVTGLIVLLVACMAGGRRGRLGRGGGRDRNGERGKDDLHD